MNDDRKAEVAILWGMTAVLVITAAALVFQGMTAVGMAILAVSVSLAVVARAAGKNSRGGDNAG